MAFCAKCGTRLVEGAAFCGVCGTPVGAGAPRYEPPPPPPPPRAYEGYARTGARPAPDLMTRVVNILTKPKEEWPVIAEESATVSSIYSGYIVILAAIPVVAGFIGTALIGSILLFAGGGIGIVAGLLAAVLQYALTLGGAYLAALVINQLAPTFQSQSDMVQALKLVAYASTAVWVAGILNILNILPIIPILGVLLGGLYSIYLFYLGLPATMKTPPDKVIPYMIVSAVVIFVIYMVIFGIVGAITAASLIGSRVIA